jgi:hypothetical protein
MSVKASRYTVEFGYRPTQFEQTILKCCGRGSSGDIVWHLSVSVAGAVAKSLHYLRMLRLAVRPWR